MSPRMNLTRSAKPASERTSFERINDTALTGLDADHGVGGLAVVTALVEAVTLRAVEDDDTQARVQILALLSQLASRAGRAGTGGQW